MNTIAECPCYSGHSLACPIHGPLGCVTDGDKAIQALHSGDGGAEIIKLPYAEDDAIPSEVDLKRKEYRCQHRYVALHESTHRLYCNEDQGGCGEEIDMYEWIENLTRDWRNFKWRYKMAKQQTEAAEARLAEVLRLERNAKARLKRASR